MNKKIIACMVVITVLFMCVFAACGKNVYTNPMTGDKYLLVTDENGDRVLSEDGELLVYVTEENGRRVKNENGEYETAVQGFIGQLEDDGVVEDYAYSVTLPKGWKTTDTKGLFENKKQSKSVEIQILDQSYDEFYNVNKTLYKQTAEQLGYTDVKWEENLDLIKGAKKLCAVTFSNADEIKLAFFFVNNGNLYNVVYTTADVKEDVQASLVEFFKNIEFKKHVYYPAETTTVPFVTHSPITTAATTEK